MEEQTQQFREFELFRRHLRTNLELYYKQGHYNKSILMLPFFPLEIPKIPSIFLQSLFPQIIKEILLSSTQVALMPCSVLKLSLFTCFIIHNKYNLMSHLRKTLIDLPRKIQPNKLTRSMRRQFNDFNKFTPTSKSSKECKQILTRSLKHIGNAHENDDDDFFQLLFHKQDSVHSERKMNIQFVDQAITKNKEHIRFIQFKPKKQKRQESVQICKPDHVRDTLSDLKQFTQEMRGFLSEINQFIESLGQIFRVSTLKLIKKIQTLNLSINKNLSKLVDLEGPSQSSVIKLNDKKTKPKQSQDNTQISKNGAKDANETGMISIPSLDRNMFKLGSKQRDDTIPSRRVTIGSMKAPQTQRLAMRSRNHIKKNLNERFSFLNNTLAEMKTLIDI